MKLGMIGLGRMGMNMAKRLIDGGHTVVVYDADLSKGESMAKVNAIPAKSLENMAELLDTPEMIWVMLPAGNITENTIQKLRFLLKPGSIIIDGSNGFFEDDIRRKKDLKKDGIYYLDAGVSGGIWGLQNGYSTMIGGEFSAFKTIEPAVKTLAPEGGYLYCGKAGAGHYVKMVHNGIEYAMMEAYGEGAEILKASHYGKDLNLADVSRLWNRGSVVRSWLLELLEDALTKDPDLSKIQGYVEDSGEARWTVKEAVNNGVAADVITASLYKRFNSRQKDVFANKVVAALRNEFGGHALARTGEEARNETAGAGTIQHARPDRGNL